MRPREPKARKTFMQDQRLATTNGDRSHAGLRRLRSVSSLVVGIGLLGGLVAYFLRGGSLTRALAQASWLTLAIAVGNAVLVAFVQSYTQQVQARALGARLGQLESFALTVVGRGGNLVTPVKAGTLFRATYLRSRHGLPLARFGSLTVGQQVTSLLVASAAGTVAVVVLWAGHGMRSWPLATIMGAGLLLALGAFVSSRTIAPGTGCLRNRLATMVNGIHRLLRHRRVATTTLAAKCLTLVLNVAVYEMLFSALGVDANWGVCLLITASAWLALLVQLVPGGLGVTELVTTLAADQLGVPAATALSVALLLRAGSVALLVIGALPSWLALRRRVAVVPLPPDRDDASG